MSEELNKDVIETEQTLENANPTPEVSPEVTLEVTAAVAPVSAPVNNAPRSEAPRRFQRPNNRDNNGRRDFRKNLDPKKKLLEEKVVSISRVTKVTAGGRHFRFSATMVVGDGKGLVGIGTGKSNEVPEAIKKGIQAANKNLVKIPLIDGRTIPHDAIGTCGRAKVLIKPAKAGTGIIAGGAVRAVLELAGVKDIVSKSLGSNTHGNVAKAALDALKSQRTPEHIAELRGKTVEEL